MKSNYTKDIVRSMAILLACVLFVGCSDKESDEPYEGGDEDIELTAEQEAYSTLAANFFQSSEPSKGRVLDEAKPSERSAIAETYESALEDFERYLPSNERETRFINRTSDGVSVDLGDLGYVRFEAFDGDGVVAKVTVALENLPRYTVLYRIESSFGDNYFKRFSVGDLVRFKCPVLKREDRTHCNSWQEGVVIQTGSELAIFTNHVHSFKESDYWKWALFEYDLVSLEGWKAIYNAWHDNRELMMDTYNHNSSNWEIKRLKQIMDGDLPYKKLYVYGPGTFLYFSMYCARSTMYAKTGALSVDDLRAGKIKMEWEWFAYRKEIKSLNYCMCSLIKVSENYVETIYPIY